jgi:HEAT repeat protein
MMIRTILTCLALAALAAPGCKKQPAPADAGAVAKPLTPPPQKPAPVAIQKPLTWREALKSSDPNVRADGVRSIDPSEGSAPPAELVAALGDASPIVRRAAVSASLGYIFQYADHSTLPKLLEMAEKDSDEEVRGAAVRALAATSHRDVVPAFVRLYPAEKSAKVREEMLATIAKEGDRRALPLLVAELQKGDPHALVFEAVRRIETTARPELIKLLESGSDVQKQRAAQALGEIGDAAAAPHLAKALKDTSADTVAAAIQALSMLGAAEPVAAIIALCDHADAKVRQSAIRALGSYRVPDAIPADEAFAKVSARLKGDTSEDVRAEAARTLGAVGLKRGVAPLRETLADAKTPPAVRAAAATALGGVGDASGVPALAAALGDSDERVRTAAAKAIGIIADASGSKALTGAWAKETHLDVRLAILASLGRLGGDDAAKLLVDVGQKDSHPLIKAEAGGALLRMGREEGLAILRPILLNAQEWQERRAAAQGLETRGWKERRAAAKKEAAQKLSGAVATLIVEALGKEKEQLVREVLFRQLGRTDGPGAVAEQRKLIGEPVPFFRLMVASGLCRNGDASGCNVLVEALGWPEAAVRFEAARRIGWYRLTGAREGLNKVLEDPVVFVANAARQALAALEKPAP